MSTPPREPDWERRRRIDEAFGDVLPEVTSDETSEDSRERQGDAAEEWLRAQVPPHHG